MLRKVLKGTPLRIKQPSSTQKEHNVETEAVPQIPVDSDQADREQWHKSVQESRDILRFLENGSPLITSSHLEALRSSTVKYLSAWSAYYSDVLGRCDDKLGALIDEHADRYYSTRDVAILACLHTISIHEANFRVGLLMNGDIGRYLRCVCLVKLANPQAIQRADSVAADILVHILDSRENDFGDLQKLVETLGKGATSRLLSPAIIHRALEKSGITTHLQKKLEWHLEQRHFKSLFRLISWLHDVPKNPNNGQILALLDSYFPSWVMLLAWNPNMGRIAQWELPLAKEAHRQKLAHIFDLDGPDTVTWKRPSLIWVEPQCYQHISVQPKTTRSLEKLLDLLSRARACGPGALDLYIYLCVDHHANETAMTMLNKAYDMKDQERYADLILALQTLRSFPLSYTQQMRHLTKALPILSDENVRVIAGLEMQPLSKRLTEVMKTAQEQFCQQLVKGTGENLGMKISEFAGVILQSSWIHPFLSPEFLPKIQRIPNEETAGVLFDQLEGQTKSLSFGKARFKSYLASSVGGEDSVDDSITLNTIQEEIQFWKQCRDIDQKGLAIVLAKISSLDYSLYTNCLMVMLKEDRTFIANMSSKMKLGREIAYQQLAVFLSDRRSLNRRQHDCWLLLLLAVISDQGASFLPTIATKRSLNEWLDIVSIITRALSPIRSQLPLAGTGITQERLAWWSTLSQYEAPMRSWLQNQGGKGSLGWLYFLSPDADIEYLLDTLAKAHRTSAVHRQVVSCLVVDGNNVVAVRNCLKAVESSSDIGRSVCERMFSRRELQWSSSQLAVVIEGWRKSGSMARADASGLDAIASLLRLPLPTDAHQVSLRAVGERLLAEYGEQLEKAKLLESIRLRLRHQHPEETSRLLRRLGIDNSVVGRVVDAEIPEELVDHIEIVGKSEYELSFALTGLSNLRCFVRGISRHSRILVLRLTLYDTPRFCIHLPPDDPRRHKCLRVGSESRPHTGICTTPLTSFTYYLNRNVYGLLQRGDSSLATIFASVSKLVNTSPERCILCGVSLGVKLWAPSTCSDQCSMELRKSPLHIQLHNLLVDALSIDLLLNCVYMAAADTSNLDLLPGCTVERSRIKEVINSFPLLQTLQTAEDLQSAIRGNDTYGQERESLLSWLCVRFRGFMMKAPDEFSVPSMGNDTKQLLMLNSHPEREQLFNSQRNLRGGTGVVFHGTQASRMFLILTQGLKAMTDTSFMLHGAASGAGIYCGDEIGTSLPYAGTMGECWTNSQVGNMRILLGCELSGYQSPPHTNAHIIADSNRLLVRYIFLLPQGFQSPPRHHVAPAMMTAFTKLRSGLK